MIDADGVTLCDHCTWQTYTGNPRTDAQRLASHVAARHPETIAPPEFADHGSLVGTGQMPQVDWLGQGIAALASQPEGATFTLYGACKHLADPPNPRTDWARLQKTAEHCGLIEWAGAARSERPTVKGSMTSVWRRTAKPAPVRQEART